MKLREYVIVNLNIRREYLIAVLHVLLIGCGPTWPKHGLALHAPEKVRVAVLPVQSLIKVRRLKTLTSATTQLQKGLNEKAFIQKEIQNITAEMTLSLEKGLRKTWIFEVISHDRVKAALDSLALQHTRSSLTKEEMKRLGAALQADAILVTRLTGYGRIKKKWLFFLIGSGVIEGVVQGVVVAEVTKNSWLALGVAAEEILQEALVWGGGAYIFDRVFTPVILEGRLVSVHDGEAVWRKTTFSSRNRKALKALPKPERKKKERRLRLTFDKARDELLRELEKQALKNAR